jgi:hypothetical protein
VPAHIAQGSTDLACIIAKSEDAKERSMSFPQKALAVALGLLLLLIAFWMADPYWTDTLMRAGNLA